MKKEGDKIDPLMNPTVEPMTMTTLNHRIKIKNKNPLIKEIWIKWKETEEEIEEDEEAIKVLEDIEEEEEVYVVVKELKAPWKHP